ncbi:MAG: holo-ACP synthase [Phycisphaeraceae bacterium]|nr:holo-ACP synthase [Phycisphaerales bacterium]QOJ16384.1 MAG: holo-ACP synthase [Phycisphaeraceae bacterium]
MRIMGHGIDLVEITRIAHMLETHGERFLARCFTAGEQAYAEQSHRLRAERYAARFAAKEAVLKALGTGWRDGIAWTDVDVTRDPAGQPGVRLSGRSAQIARERGITGWLLSLSHSDSHAIASALAVGNG